MRVGGNLEQQEGGQAFLLLNSCAVHVEDHKIRLHHDVTAWAKYDDR